MGPCKYSPGNFDTTKGPISTSFFSGAKTNIAWNCLDEQISKGRGDTAAFVWEGNGLGENKTMSYSEVCSEVNKLANWLRRIGVEKGDRVVIYMPMILELPILCLHVRELVQSMELSLLVSLPSPCHNA